tara:strand:+ start:348 stop:812 length:465 start_codon:yes stop_codon:yes gene_type:complete
LNILKRNGRSSFRSGKRYNFSKPYSSFTNNKSRTKGNVEHLYSKYIKLAKEASSSGDRIQAEYYYQFADHYSRNMPDVDVKSLGNENIREASNKKYPDNSTLDGGQETIKSSIDDNVKSSEKTNIADEINENEKSLDSVSFISQPAKKTVKLKK